MGRKRVKISYIEQDRSRHATFNKRKNGLLKKAYELSVLCGCEIGVIIFSRHKMVEYSSHDMDRLLLKYTEFDGHHEIRTNKDYESLKGIEADDDDSGPGSPEDFRSSPIAESSSAANQIDGLRLSIPAPVPELFITSGTTGGSASAAPLPIINRNNKRASEVRAVLLSHQCTWAKR
ncbi:hypothetical protein BC831DRAFT_235651 [Entophlyctis helioformis]|nr:hypothetical protein BC831DRAFT_235651 [Entophlyctis helioformis]